MPQRGSAISGAHVIGYSPVVDGVEFDGVEFDGVDEARWRRLTRFRLTGGSWVRRYEPRHPRATEL